MADNTDVANVSKDKLVTDMKIVIADAEEILRPRPIRLARRSANCVNASRSVCGTPKVRLQDAEAALVDKTRRPAPPTISCTRIPGRRLASLPRSASRWAS